MEKNLDGERSGWKIKEESTVKKKKIVYDDNILRFYI